VTSTEAYDVQLSPAASRAFKKLTPDARRRVRTALERLAVQAAQTGRIGGKTVKTIQGGRDSFHRLRVGDLRVMYDVLVDDGAILVLGIVDRGDLERRLRNR
jgi:mRNA-degrading endonuclease RelE of RelBE toxin-antitoxin system